MTERQKTHWLQNPNKNYLGHWDLVEGRDVVLTIGSAKWEEVTNPITRSSEAKRVIRFREGGFKPFICNEVNSQTILRSTGVKYMEDSLGLKIQLGVSQTKVAGETIDCLRVRNIPQDRLVANMNRISEDQLNCLAELLVKAHKDIDEFCQAMKISSISELPEVKYEKVISRLNKIIEENANN